MEAYMGMIAMFGFNYAPEGFTFCNGSQLAMSQYQALYSLIGPIYGSATAGNFKLPDLKSRAPIGFNMGGQPSPLTMRAIGAYVGSETAAMTLAQLPAHTHTATFTPSGGGAAAAVAISTSNGTKAVPAAGDHLAVPMAGFDQTNAYTNSPGTTVPLGGVTGGGGGGGTVAVGPNGGGQAMPILNPVLAINFSICTNGLYPVRP